MSNLYRVVAIRAVRDIEPGQVGELELGEEEEADLLDSGRIVVVPREYVVVGPREVLGAGPGERFKAALRVPQERSLLAGGHIERLEHKKPASAGKEQ